MTIYNRGIKKFSAARTDDGHREYRVTHLVETTTPYNSDSNAGDGPEAISGASGLPAFGDFWNYGNDSDVWALVHPQRRVTAYDQKEGESSSFFLVESLFSTKPLNRCMTAEWGDPLLEPQRVSGASQRYTLEAFKDRDGEPIMSSSHEMVRGPQVEFDADRHTVRIEQNVSTLQLDLVTSLMNKLNDDVLWGLGPRRIKLSGFTWEEKWYGTCTYYYTRVFDFDVRNNPNDLFDRSLLDEGTKVLNGHWARTAECGGGNLWVLDNVCGATPDKDNPQHFTRYKDLHDENSRVVLDGKGMPADSTTGNIGTGTVVGTGTDSTDPPGQILVEYYEEADLTQLGIPADIDFGTATPD